MTRYPGRTGIGAERPPLPNVLPVPATLGTPITESAAIVRMCFVNFCFIYFYLDVIGNLNGHQLSSVCCPSSHLIPLKTWPAVQTKLFVCCHVPLRCCPIFNRFCYSPDCLILYFSSHTDVFSDKRHFRLPPQIDYSSQRPQWKFEWIKVEKAANKSSLGIWRCIHVIRRTEWDR